MYPIKKVVSITGISAITLRAWERRYQPIEPKRDSNGYRSYSRQDIHKLTLMVEAKEQGHTISKISKLSIAELKTLLKDPHTTLQKTKNSPYSQLINQVLEALNCYQITRCEELLKRSLMAVDLPIFITEIISPLLNKVGDKWASNKITISQEHLITGCIRRILFTSINHYSTNQQNQQNHCDFLFATPTGEDHELGILMCHLMAAKNNFNCTFVGANLPLDELKMILNKVKPKIIVLGLTNTPPNTKLIAQLQELIELLNKGNTELWLGGGGAVDIFDYKQFKNCKFVSSFHYFNHLLSLRSKGYP